MNNSHSRYCKFALCNLTSSIYFWNLVLYPGRGLSGLSAVFTKILPLWLSQNYFNIYPLCDPWNPCWAFSLSAAPDLNLPGSHLRHAQLRNKQYFQADILSFHSATSFSPVPWHPNPSSLSDSKFHLHVSHLLDCYSFLGLICLCRGLENALRNKDLLNVVLNSCASHFSGILKYRKMIIRDE